LFSVGRRGVGWLRFQFFSPALEEAEVEEDLSASHECLVVAWPVNTHLASILFSAKN